MSNITKKDLWNLHLIFDQMKNYGSQKFKYNLLRNIKIISNEIDPLVEIHNPIKDILNPLESEKNNLIVELGNDIGNGQFSLDLNNKEMTKEFNNKMMEISKKYTKEIDEFNKRMAGFNGLLEDKIDFTLPSFYKLNAEDLPNDISFAAMEILDKFEMLDE